MRLQRECAGRHGAEPPAHLISAGMPDDSTRAV